MFKCVFCDKESETKVGIGRHAAVCINNPNRKIPNRAGKPAWNSGLKNDPRCQISEENANNLRLIVKSRSAEWYKQHGKVVSKTINQKVENGTWHTSLAKKMHVNYKGVDLHGSWELAYAKWLDSQNIRWKRNTETFSYVFENKTRKYTPDFYLIDSDEYVEIKGYQTAKDNAKWSQFPSYRKLKVMKHAELKALQII